MTSETDVITLVNDQNEGSSDVMPVYVSTATGKVNTLAPSSSSNAPSQITPVTEEITRTQNQGDSDVMPVYVSTTTGTVSTLAPSTSNNVPNQIISSSTPVTEKITRHAPTQMTQESQPNSPASTTYIPKSTGNATRWRMYHSWLTFNKLNITCMLEYTTWW